jgi:glutaredoxin
VKAWLSRAGIRFEERSVMTDDAAYDELLSLGFRRVPVTVIGELMVQGYDPEALAFHTRHLRGTVESETTDEAGPPSE